jgi:hypothetical protein
VSELGCQVSERAREPAMRPITPPATPRRVPIPSAIFAWLMQKYVQEASGCPIAKSSPAPNAPPVRAPIKNPVPSMAWVSVDTSVRMIAARGITELNPDSVETTTLSLVTSRSSPTVTRLYRCSGSRPAVVTRTREPISRALRSGPRSTEPLRRGRGRRRGRTTTCGGSWTRSAFSLSSLRGCAADHVSAGAPEDGGSQARKGVYVLT